jgi:MarR family transcriptional regulator, organic hydroperoxide resistance regulator
MEACHTTSRARQQARRWARTLERELDGVRGVAVEDKGLSLAVHYRRARGKAKARARILAAARGLGAVRLLGGKDVVNVLPAGAPHKGTALERALPRLGCDRAIYVGDDDTDEDVFALERPGRLLAVRVGRKSGSAAAWFVRRQADVDRLLLRLVALRASTRKEKTVREDTRGGRSEGAPPPPLGEALDFMRLLWAIDHGLQRRSKRMAAALGVTGPQRLVIRIVGRSPGISAGQLARVMHLHPSTLTGILRRLEKRGLLERGRDERDLRRAVLTLSSAGRRLDVDASGTVEALTRGVLSSLPRRQVAAAREVLQALAQGLEREPATHRGPKPRR